MKKLFAIISYAFITTLLLVVASVFVLPLLPFEDNIQVKIVKSGSMEPAIETGSIVVIRPFNSYEVGDVITFGNDTPTTFPTTHRIVSISEGEKGILYGTKGDANEEQDPSPVPAGEVIGKVFLTVPKAGYILDFTKKPLGFLLIIALPAAFVILNELIDVFREIKKVIRKRRGENNAEGSQGKGETIFKRLYKMDDLLRPVYVVQARAVERAKSKGAIATLVFVLSLSLVSANFGKTTSFFADIERSLDNIVSAMAFEISASSTPQVSYVGALEGATITNEVSPEPEGLPNEYDVKVVKTGGSDAFCGALIMNSTSTPPFVYNGPLLAFDSPPTIFSGNWWFDVTLDPLAEGINPEDTCVIELVYTANAWLEDKGTHGGYSDVERVPLTFNAAAVEAQESQLPAPTIPAIVLNEIYPNPNGTSTPLDKEFIELYNNGTEATDVLGWYISDLVGASDNEEFSLIVSHCATPVSKKLAPFGAGSTVVAPGGFLILQYCQTPERLNNDGDTVTLYNQSTTTIDSHAYPDTDPGKSHSRIPDGTGAWVDPVPTPGFTNIGSDTPSELEIEVPTNIGGGGSSVPEPIVENTETATTTEPIIEDKASTTTPEILPEPEDSASTTPETLPEPINEEPVEETLEPEPVEPEPVVEEQ